MPGTLSVVYLQKVSHPADSCADKPKDESQSCGENHDKENEYPDVHQGIDLHLPEADERQRRVCAEQSHADEQREKCDEQKSRD